MTLEMRDREKREKFMALLTYVEKTIFQKNAL